MAPATPGIPGQGQRSADVLRNSMGSWPFVRGFVLFMLPWVAANSFIRPGQSWDPYPYILLNLFLSMLAGLQGVILLIAAKRQDAIAAAMAQHDLDTAVGSKTDLDLLLELNQAQLAMIQELRTELQRLGKPGTGPVTGSKRPEGSWGTGRGPHPGSMSLTRHP